MVYHGDCRVVLPTLPADSVDTVITDPPYHLTSLSRNGSPRRNDPETPFGRTRLGERGFMGKTWDGGGVAFEIETWREALRVAKPGAMLLAFGGTRTSHRLACAIEDAGWEIRDCLMWIYGSGFPKSLDISKVMDLSRNEHITAPATDLARQWHGWGTALKPAYEPIILAMKPLDGTFAENAERHGVAGLWIDGGRIGSERTIRKCGPVHNPNIMRIRASALDKAGIHGSSCGRWPANVLHDGSEDVLRLFPAARSGGNLVASAPAADHSRVYGKGYKRSVVAPGINSYNDSGSAARFFYCAKASPSERGDGNNHPTVKPLALMRYLCRLTRTPTGGVVLDPFAGSGTTLLAARAEGRQAIGIEQSEEYATLIRQRLGEIPPPDVSKPAMSSGRIRPLPLFDAVADECGSML